MTVIFLALVIFASVASAGPKQVQLKALGELVNLR